MDAPTFHYAERAPAAELQGWILNHWGFEVRVGGPAPPPHHVPPDGCTSLVVVCPQEGAPTQVTVSGPWVEPLVVYARPGSRYRGFRCRPDTGGLILGCDPARLVNRVQPAGPLLGSLAEQLGRELAAAADMDASAAIVNRLLLPHVRALPEPDALVRLVVTRLWGSGGQDPVSALAQSAGVSPRTLLRRFRRATGLSPKRYARIARLWRAAHGLLREDLPPWARLAAEAGYADQAHLSHEFSQLTGLSPSAFGDRVRATSHDNVRPDRYLQDRDGRSR